MKTIPLTQGFVTLVDDTDYGQVSAFKWRALVDRRRNKVYAVRKTHGPHRSRKSLYMHREILGVTDPQVKVDHRNGDSLDNRRANLRKCVNGENNANSAKRRECSSKYKVSAGTSGMRNFRHQSECMAGQGIWARSQMKYRQHTHTMRRRVNTLGSSHSATFLWNRLR